MFPPASAMATSARVKKRVKKQPAKPNRRNPLNLHLAADHASVRRGPGRDRISRPKRPGGLWPRTISQNAANTKRPDNTNEVRAPIDRNIGISSALTYLGCAGRRTRPSADRRTHQGQWRSTGRRKDPAARQGNRLWLEEAKPPRQTLLQIPSMRRRWSQTLYACLE